MQKKEKKLKEGRKFVLRLADIFGYSRLLANNFHMAAMHLRSNAMCSINNIAIRLVVRCFS